MRTARHSFGFLFIIMTNICCTAQKPEAERIKHHIRILANDSLQGRGTGSEGERMAAAYISNEFRKLKLSPAGEKGSFMQSFEFKSGVHGTGTAGTANNIVALLDNGATNTIIIGAHYDHLGLGNDGNSLEANSQGKIHNGADDNASGTAGVLELARYFATNSSRE